MHALKPSTVGYAVIVLTLISVAISAKASYDSEQTTDEVVQAQVELAKVQVCIANFLLENKRVNTARAAATEAKDEVLNKYIDGVTKLTLNPDPDPRVGSTEFRKLTLEYRAAAKKLRSERAKNPLPDLPATCQEIPVPVDEEEPK